MQAGGAQGPAIENQVEVSYVTDELSMPWLGAPRNARLD